VPPSAPISEGDLARRHELLNSSASSASRARPVTGDQPCVPGSICSSGPTPHQSPARSAGTSTDQNWHPTPAWI